MKNNQHTQYILVVGKGFSGQTNAIQRAGYEYIILKDRAQTTDPEIKRKRRVICDFSTKETILQTVDTLPKGIIGVTTLYENYILATAWITEHLGLPGMPVSAAEACTDKELMRERFARAPEPISPDFMHVTSEDDLRNFAATHEFPLMLKPANLVKSLLVTKNHSLEELLENYRQTMERIDAVYQKYAPLRHPKLLVEEFLQGSTHSVEAFADASGEPTVLKQIVDYQTGYDAGFNDNFTYSRLLPSRLSTEDQEAVRHCARLGVQALGMQSSPAHIEIIVTPKGPRIVEIGARNGGYRERMHWLANGLDIPQIALQVALGKKPTIQPLKNEPCAVIELFPKEPGIFKQLHGEAKLRALPSLQYLSIKPKPGQVVGKAADGYKMCVVIILHHRDAAQCKQDLDFVNDQVFVEVEA